MIGQSLSAILLTVLGALVGGGGAAAAQAAPRTIALLSIRNSAGDLRALRAVDDALVRELGAYGELVDRAAIRRVRRALRIRDTDHVPPRLLQRLAADLSADWLVAITLHDAERRLVPRLTLSGRAYDAAGEPFWVAFEGASGLDARRVLGLGVIEEVEDLAPRSVARLLSSLAEGGGTSSGARFGGLALVPFESLTSASGTAASETITEAARAAVFARGFDVASSNCSHAALRSLRSTRRGAVDEAMREALRTTCGAAAILTGAVETYDVGGSGLEPEPRVAVAMRLLDAATGKILWTGALEREGWDRAGLFRSGRIYSRGALTRKMMDKLADDLERHWDAWSRRAEELS